MLYIHPKYATALSPEKLWLLVVIVRFRSHHDHMNYNFFTFQSFLPCKNTRGSFCFWGYLFSCFPTPYCWMLSPLQSWGRWVRSGGPPVPLILDRPPQYWNSPHGPLPPHPNPTSSLISPIFRISTKADVAKSASSSYNKIHISFKASCIVENTQWQW